MILRTRFFIIIDVLLLLLATVAWCRLQNYNNDFDLEEYTPTTENNNNRVPDHYGINNLNRPECALILRRMRHDGAQVPSKDRSYPLAFQTMLEALRHDGPMQVYCRKCPIEPTA